MIYFQKKQDHPLKDDPSLFFTQIDNVDDTLIGSGDGDTTQPQIKTALAKAATRETLDEVYAEMASADLIPFHRLGKSQQIRKGLTARNYKPVKTRQGVIKKVNKYARKVKAKYKKFFKTKIAHGMRFSVTNDEATKFNRRYAVVNVHMPGGVPFGLGQVRILGKLDSPAAAELVRKKLAEFNLDAKCDIVANTTDGASVISYLCV